MDCTSRRFVASVFSLFVAIDKRCKSLAVGRRGRLRHARHENVNVAKIRTASKSGRCLSQSA